MQEDRQFYTGVEASEAGADTFQVSAEVIEALLHASQAFILGDVSIGHYKAVLTLLILILFIVHVIILHVDCHQKAAWNLRGSIKVL